MLSFYHKEPQNISLLKIARLSGKRVKHMMQDICYIVCAISIGNASDTILHWHKFSVDAVANVFAH